MNEKEYIPRVLDDQVQRYLDVFGAICIEGPKWCGKTMTSQHHSESSFFVGDPARAFNNRTMAMMDPAVVLNGAVPRMLDEWQEVPSLWDAVRYAVDERGGPGQFILTGSSTPVQKGILHSGAGRIARIRMRPMSLFESGDSTGQVSLGALFRQESVSAMTGEVSLERLIQYIIRGGWPQTIRADFSLARLTPKEYIRAILADDLSRLDGVRRDMQKVSLLLRSLARNESTTVSNRTLVKDIKDHGDGSLHIGTVAEYLSLFDRLFLTDNQKPFSPNVRSTVRIRQAEKRHLADPSLACAVLGITQGALLQDLRTLGFLFEALCERDLAVYAQAHGSELYHYQDYAGREIDAVIELQDGNWGAFEIKLGANQIDEAAKNLISLYRSFAEAPVGRPPQFLCVICGLSNAAYRRPDGVYVVPITALKD